MIVPGAPSAVLLASMYTLNLPIAADTNNYSMYTAALAGGWDGVVPINLTVTISAGVVVGSTSTSTPALKDTDVEWPAGSIITLVNNGTIAGCGGNGRSANTGFGIYQTPGQPGYAGGPALRCNSNKLRVANYGTIGGGGGGGGAGGGAHDPSWGDSPAGGGGGGAGRSIGTAGAGAPGQDHPNSTAGSVGTLTTGGAGGTGQTGAPSGAYGGNGGKGGDLGYAGNAGGNGGAGGDGGPMAGGAGGAAGAAVVGNAAITWLVTGTRLGSLT